MKTQTILKEHILPNSFYERDDVVSIAKELLGKYVYTNFEGVWTGGKIVETEAYCGATDKACHAHLNRRTNRTQTMFLKGGVAYVYLCYGIHHLFNIVTNKQDHADAVLVRGIEPTVGIEKMMERRNMKKLQNRITAGPGCLTQALGMTTDLDKSSVSGPNIWLTDYDLVNSKKATDVEESQVIKGPRVGIDYAGEDAKLPWRFSIKDNKWVSPAK